MNGLIGCIVYVNLISERLEPYNWSSWLFFLGDIIKDCMGFIAALFFIGSLLILIENILKVKKVLLGNALLLNLLGAKDKQAEKEVEDKIKEYKASFKIRRTRKRFLFKVMFWKFLTFIYSFASLGFIGTATQLTHESYQFVPFAIFYLSKIIRNQYVGHPKFNKIFNILCEVETICFVWGQAGRITHMIVKFILPLYLDVDAATAASEEPPSVTKLLKLAGFLTWISLSDFLYSWFRNKLTKHPLSIVSNFFYGMLITGCVGLSCMFLTNTWIVWAQLGIFFVSGIILFLSWLGLAKSLDHTDKREIALSWWNKKISACQKKCIKVTALKLFKCRCWKDIQLGDFWLLNKGVNMITKGLILVSFFTMAVFAILSKLEQVHWHDFRRN